MNRGMSSHSPVIVWFRQDLRLADNPALSAAANTGRPILPVYVLDQGTPGTWARGGASLWWLHHSLQRLKADLQARGLPLILRRGTADQVLPELAAACGATVITWNRCYEPWAIDRDTRLKAHLTESGVAVDSHNGALLFEPWTIQTKSGSPYRVFSPFWRACLQAPAPEVPLPVPAKLPAPDMAPPGDDLDGWALLPTAPDWAGGLRDAWTPGDAGAQARLADFVDGILAGYAGERDRPDIDGTSRLSPHLHFGEISPRQIWHTVHARLAQAGGSAGVEKAAAKFLSEIGWREFSYHLLFQFRELPEKPLQPTFADFPWQPDAAAYRQWCRGLTGYPIVDAGMRQLWQTGWMHNRVRMIAASFLVKDLLIPWQDGARWFWDTLVDADLANNSAGWQWVAGCGADAAPYFRVFNPVTQGERFDPEGRYVRAFVPELGKLPDKWLHRPWEAPADVVAAAGVRLGETYPKPMVDHAQARQAALAAYEQIKKT